MDLLSLSRESFDQIISFCRTQAEVWIRILRNPVTEIYKYDLTSPETAWSSIQFAIFMLVVTLAIEVPLNVLFRNVKLQQPQILLSEVIIYAITICLWGVLLYFPGKLVAGKGRFADCMVVGFFLSAFWPVFAFGDYVMVSNGLIRSLTASDPLTAYQTYSQWSEQLLSSDSIFPFIAPMALGAISACLFVWYCVKTYSVVKRLHSIGIVRYLLLLVFQYGALVVLAVFVFDPIQAQLGAVK